MGREERGEGEGEGRLSLRGHGDVRPHCRKVRRAVEDGAERRERTVRVWWDDVSWFGNKERVYVGVTVEWVLGR